MPPEMKEVNGIVLKNEHGKTVYIGEDGMFFNAIETSINQHLEKEAMEEQKALKKAQRDEKLKALTSYIMLANTIIDLYILAKGIYFGFKELKKRGK